MSRLELSSRQLSALSDGTRADIVNLLSRDGPQSVRELGDALGRSASSLYIHLHKLQDVGLVCETGSRPTARRPQIVYGLVERRLSSNVAARSPSGRSALAKLSQRLLMSAARSVGRALLSKDSVIEGTQRDTGVRRIHLRLNPADLAIFNEELDDLIDRTFDKADANGLGIEFTIALSPAPVRRRRTS